MAREKCVLAYSGGMDSTISVVWIQEQYDLDIVTLTVDLGAGLRSRACGSAPPVRVRSTPLSGTSETSL